MPEYGGIYPGSIFSSGLLSFVPGSNLRLFKPPSFGPGAHGCVQTLSVQFLRPTAFVSAVSESRMCAGLCPPCHGVFSAPASSTFFINQHSLICSASSRNLLKYLFYQRPLPLFSLRYFTFHSL